MSFIEDNLINDEEMVYKTEVSWFVYLEALIWFALALTLFVTARFGMSLSSPAVIIFCMFVAMVGLVKFVEALIHQTCTEIGITNKRMVAKFGFIARKTLEIPLNRIESVTIDQSVLERITFCGTVAVRGTGHAMAPVRFIDNPVEFRNALNEAIADYKGGDDTIAG